MGFPFIPGDDSAKNLLKGVELKQQTSVFLPDPGQTKLFAKADGIYQVDSSSIERRLVGTDQLINIIPNISQTASNNWVTTNATVSTDVNSSTNNPLHGITVSSVRINSSTSGGYAAIRWTQPSGLQNQPINVSFWSKLTVASDYKVELYYNSASNYGGAYTRVTLNSDVAGVSNLNGGSTQFKTFFVEQGQSFYELRLVRTAASAATAYFTQVGVGILSQLGNGFAGSDWQSYTPTYSAALGTVSTSSIWWKRSGDTLSLSGYFVGGVNTAAIAAFTMPNGLLNDTAKRGSAQYPVVGRWWRINGTVSTRKTGLIVSNNTADNNLYFTSDDYTTASAPNTTLAGNVLLANGDTMFVEVYGLPITGWSSNVTQADSASFEFAHVASGTTTPTVYGPGGSVLGTGRAGQAITLTWQGAYQSTDTLVVEWQAPGTDDWVQRFPYTGVGASTYGAAVVGTSTTNTVQLQFATTGYDQSTGATWDSISTWRWRLRRVGNGLVGLPLGARNIVGDVSGTAVPSGMIGEQVRVAQTTSASFPATAIFGDLGSITLTPGVWDISCTLLCLANLASVTSFFTGVGTTSGNSSAGLVDGDNYLYAAFSASTQDLSLTVPSYRVLVTATTTYYQKVRATYTVATPQYRGRISAVRVG